MLITSCRNFPLLATPKGISREDMYVCMYVVYQTTVLDPIVKTLGLQLFNGQTWSFQQDSAPAHKAKTTQAWFRSNNIEFISSEEWPSGSPDLNPLDYNIWNYIEEKACSKPHRSLESLKKAITKAVREIDMNFVRNSIDDWPRRLRSCIQARGGHFE